MIINFKCPNCGELTSINFTDDQYNRYLQFLNEHKFINDALPDLTQEQRYTIISDFCFCCQDFIFKKRRKENA